MSSENFQILKEINSLSIRINELNDLIANENKRISFIENNRSDRETLRDELTQQKIEIQKDLVGIENTIALTSDKISKDQFNLTSLVDDNSIKSLTKQIDEAQTKLDLLEENGLELLDQVESLEEKISDSIEFLEGSLQSLKEIQTEVNQTNTAYQSEITSLQSRLSLLQDQLPDSFQSRLKLVISKKISLSNFTRIKNESCEFCRFSLSKMDIKSIEDKLSLKTCQSCSRIFLPKASF